MSLTHDDLKKLAEPFAEKTIGIKVQSFSGDKTKAMLVAYAQHTDVAARLDSVDPTWSTRSVAVVWTGNICTVRLQLTLKGVTRENVGDGDDEKSAYSDALKRCAMLFGVGRYLYDAEQVWVSYNPQTDKFKSFSYQDYKRANRGAPLPTGGAPAGSAKETARPPSAGAPAPKAETKIAPTKRSHLIVELGTIAKELGMSAVDMKEWTQAKFGQDPGKLTELELQELIGQLKAEAVRGQSA